MTEAEEVAAIPLVEERLEVDKRQVESGRVRVRVAVDTREVAERGLLQDRVIEIGEMREEAVVSKQAVVQEELVIRKDVEERTQRVSETLRRTEIDVERIEAEPQPAEGGQDAGGSPAR